MVEMRLCLTYGDYLAVSLSKLRTSELEGYLWQGKAITWSEVATYLEPELEAEQHHQDELALLPGTPTKPAISWLDDLAKAAEAIGTTRDQLVFEIQAYANRNAMCHTGIKKMIDECDLAQLTQRIVDDKMLLNLVYRYRPHDQLKIRACISSIQDEWFSSCFSHGSRAVFGLTDKANPRVARLQMRQRPR